MESRRLAAALVLLFAVVGATSDDGPRKLIVILVDGFRWDYFEMPGLNLKAYPHFVKEGVKAPFVNTVHPSLSYPNINSFATGLYPESHGFVENYLWDKKTNKFFKMIPEINTTDPMWWQQSEPIWITSEKQKKLAAVYWWAGCEVARHGYNPSICERHCYDPPTKQGKNDFYQRIDDVVEMFQPSPALQRERLDLAMFYNSWVDWAGHYRGEGSKELKQSIQYIDDILDYLLTALKKAKLQHKVNIMVVSDHGMQDIRNATFITLDKYAANIKYQVNTGPTSALVPMDGKEDKLYNDIKNDNIKGLHIYKAKDIPESYHTKNALRIAPLVLETDPLFFIKGLQDSSKRIGDTYFQYYGEHGYDPVNDQDMKSFFMAMGPDFRSGFKPTPFDIIDIYNVMCHILKIEPSPNNGSWEHVEPMLRKPSDGPFLASTASVVSVGYLLISILICISSYRGWNNS